MILNIGIYEDGNGHSHVSLLAWSFTYHSPDRSSIMPRYMVTNYVCRIRYEEKNKKFSFADNRRVNEFA